MIRVARTIPGELTGEVDPEHFGFEVIPDELDEQEIDRLAKDLYEQTKQRTGLVSPPVERYMAAVASKPVTELPADDEQSTSERQSNERDD